MQTSSGQNTINGLYTMTRALGFHGDKTVKNYIHPIPTIRSHKLDPNFICIIVATKGLWNSLTYDKVAEIVLQVSSLFPAFFSFGIFRLMFLKLMKAFAVV